MIYHQSGTPGRNRKIYSLTGNLVFSKILTPTLGTNQVEISSNQLGNLTGMYIIKVCSRNESHALKLILK
ncbi:MAG: T9SS type A sorting domain-containing protein [Saprospiraceae bacterium]|nr:T9SS type A sorting domain-containing protein [Saprospiraceae bacterium]